MERPASERKLQHSHHGRDRIWLPSQRVKAVYATLELHLGNKLRRKRLPVGKEWSLWGEHDGMPIMLMSVETAICKTMEKNIYYCDAKYGVKNILRGLPWFDFLYVSNWRSNRGMMSWSQPTIHLSAEVSSLPQTGCACVHYTESVYVSWTWLITLYQACEWYQKSQSILDFYGYIIANAWLFWLVFFGMQGAKVHDRVVIAKTVFKHEWDSRPKTFFFLMQAAKVLVPSFFRNLDVK